MKREPSGKTLIICGSPRRGNSEAICKELKRILGKDAELLLLRKAGIGRCGGCVEYCNRRRTCWKKDGWKRAEKLMRRAAGFVFVTPNYFKMPPGIFKDFIDRSSVFYYRRKELDKPAAVVAVGTDTIKNIDVCRRNVEENFCKTSGMRVLPGASFRSKSELKGEYDQILSDKDVLRRVARVAQGLARATGARVQP